MKEKKWIKTEEMVDEGCIRHPIVSYRINLILIVTSLFFYIIINTYYIVLFINMCNSFTKKA